ncbi:hypothetical protein QUF88_07365 [Bacillus sp. DX1.1]|uniref:hypothetical protein n=1 Tax=unclassified Bacillus (in: firmicutes) TaxID=185979 RepID=UPI00256FD40D|nr:MULTISPECIES: hypothetical protein [unclassified Bacillus (in: firmicutes)]MDM5153652.1 hypothetical protein [Bacillus sp. DX1.1]WJE82594.1 hypothetical protein QRE67_04870 [Bacillus sp. DX3.1]
MEQTNINIKLSLIQLFLLILNLFIFSSRMRFLPWFVEDAVGWLGIFITSPLLIFIGLKMTSLKKNKKSTGYFITKIKQSIPFIASIFSLSIVLLPITDLSNLIALAFNFGMVIITTVFLFQDLFKLNEI